MLEGVVLVRVLQRNRKKSQRDEEKMIKLIQYTYGSLNFMHLITFPNNFAIKDDYMTLDTKPENFFSIS